MKKEFNKDSEILKKKQTEIVEMKNSISQRKNSMENLSSWIDQIENRISGLEQGK
jgi:polyhydroxyalkanoate synthesis regulator phasin